MYLWMIRQRERLAGIVGASALAAPVAAVAQSTIDRPSGVPDQFKTFERTIESAFNIVIVVAGVVFVILFLVGGISYLTAAGNEDATKKARTLMLDAVIGLVIVVTSWAIGTYVLSLLGIRGASSGSLPTTVE